MYQFWTGFSLLHAQVSVASKSSTLKSNARGTWSNVKWQVVPSWEFTYPIFSQMFPFFPENILILAFGEGWKPTDLKPYWSRAGLRPPDQYGNKWLLKKKTCLILIGPRLMSSNHLPPGSSPSPRHRVPGSNRCPVRAAFSVGAARRSKGRCCGGWKRQRVKPRKRCEIGEANEFEIEF